MSIEVKHIASKLVVSLPYSVGDCNVACGTQKAKIRCSREGAYDLLRTVATAMGREDVAALCFEVPRDE